MTQHTEHPPSQPEAAPLLEVRRLVRTFGERRVIDSLDMAQRGPGIVAVTGPNGSGKTTLMRMLAQLLLPTSGTICVDGVLFGADAAADARRRVGYVPHEPLAYTVESCRSNLSYAARLGGMRRAEAAAATAEAVRHWRLEPVADRMVGELSRGWRQRYAFARADLFCPPVMLLDEPTAGLDAAGRTLLDEALQRWADSRAVVVASHERGFLERHADKWVELDATDATTAGSL